MRAYYSRFAPARSTIIFMRNNAQETKLKALRQGHINSFFPNDQFDEEIVEQPLGELFLPTGEIVANDPLCLYETEPFEQSVPAGKYPVILYVHHIDDDCRVAFAEIRFTENVPSTFEPAHTKQQDATTLGEDEYFGYGVDSGTGSFMDKVTCDALVTIMEELEDGGMPELDHMLEESYVYTYATANFQLPNSDNNLVAFSTGFGDGCCPSFWGYDKNGELCCLITDFMTVDNPEGEEIL